MPLVEATIASKFQPIFKNYAKQAYIAMGAAGFGEDLSPEAMIEASAEVFATTFATCSLEFATELVKVLKEDMLLVPALANGAGPCAGTIAVT